MVTIDDKAIQTIKDRGIRFFNASGDVGVDQRDAQIILTIMGLIDYLKSKGVDPGFELKARERRDDGHTPLDDIG